MVVPPVGIEAIVNNELLMISGQIWDSATDCIPIPSDHSPLQQRLFLLCKSTNTSLFSGLSMAVPTIDKILISQATPFNM